ncbi:hypothetical protein LZ24_01138 [Desulfobotulus alkaliphilus]|uniref:Double zinc ribbon protein n=1 Tax=Desulfobotulus alkaliphilus TaxID=622671 RepID=A0A562RZ55_9BACT|nr:hypothetical protein [Desulfobotulus alkaliphilus]TWI74198.1 hypothetical protein LZ24_01138 [Desulfobotulus alkaliphilus]
MDSFVIISIIAVIIGIIPAFIASSKGRDFVLWWIYGASLFVFAMIHAILLKPNEEQLIREGKKHCPYCDELIKPKATVCRYCSRELPSEQEEFPVSTKETKFCHNCANNRYHGFSGYKCKLTKNKTDTFETCGNWIQIS